MPDYPTTVEHYGPDGLVDTEVIHNDLTGEDEQRHLSPERIRQSYATLREWSADAAQVNTDWATMTQGRRTPRSRRRSAASACSSTDSPTCCSSRAGPRGRRYGLTRR